MLRRDAYRPDTGTLRIPLQKSEFIGFESQPLTPFLKSVIKRRAQQVGFRWGGSLTILSRTLVEIARNFISMALTCNWIAATALFCSSCGDSSSIDRLGDLAKNNSLKLL